MPAFDNRNDVGRWLEGRSQADATALALRAALRVAPALRKTIGPTIFKADQCVDGAQLYFKFVANAWAEAASADELTSFGDLAFDDAQQSVTVKIYTDSAQTAFQKRTWDFLAAARAVSASRSAQSVAAATASDAIRFTVYAVSDAAIAASLTVNDFRPSPAAAKATFLACAADATALETGVKVDQLFEQPLWPNGAPQWVRPNWAMIRAYLSIQKKTSDRLGDLVRAEIARNYSPTLQAS